MSEALIPAGGAVEAGEAKHPTALYNEIEPPDRAWLVYVVEHRGSGRRYVGISCNLSRRWAEHLRAAEAGAVTALAAAIRKYGAEAFALTTIACCRTWVDACATERLLIQQLATKAPSGFNLTDGGEGAGGLTAEIVERIAKGNRGRKWAAEALARRALSQTGIKRSDITKAAISAARKGKPLSAEHRQKLSAAKAGKKMPSRTPEHAAKIVEAKRTARERRIAEASTQ